MSNSSKRICIITQPEVVNTVGGAITVFINLANMLQKNGYDITAMCFAFENNRPKNLSQDINFVNLNYFYDQKLDFSNAINKYLSEYSQDLLIFFFPNIYVNANLSKELEDIPPLLMFHSRPDVYFIYDKTLKNKLEASYKNAYSMVLLPSFVDLLPDFVKRNPVFVIGNSAFQQNYSKDNTVEHKKIIYLTRFDNFKGLEFLIDSFKYVVKKHPDWCLDLYGQFQPVEYEYYIQEKIDKLKLSKNIKIMGITKEPIETYKNYDFSVITSEFEGFGIGLAEALSTGLPSIGLKGCSGVNELIIDGYNGFLCNKKIEDFSEKINTLIENKSLRFEFSKNAVKSIEQYSPEVINKKWLNVIENILDKKNFNNEIVANNKSKYKLFDLNEVFAVKELAFKDYIFSIKPSLDGRHKIIRILGLKFKQKYKKKL